MKFLVSEQSILAHKTDLLVVPFRSLKKDSAITELDKSLKGVIKGLVADKEIKEKKGSSLLIHTHNLIPAKRLLLTFLDEKETSLETLRHLVGEAARRAVGLECKTMSLLTDISVFPKEVKAEDIGQVVGEGALMGTYRFAPYKKEQDIQSLNTISIIPTTKEKTAYESGLEKGSLIGQGVNEARTLSNTPSNFLYPEAFVQHAKTVFAKLPVTIEVIDTKKAKQLGMGAFLGVSQGSIHAPYILILRYEPVKKEKPIVLVGKGITFDSGGISIKPSLKMGEMKGDMSGASAVFGSLLAIAQLKPKKNVIGIMPLAENMPSHTAQRPGDVVTAMNKKTIEITNTDAEGRLVLADALCYAVTLKPKAIVDIATLTGAAVVALGEVASGLFSNTPKMIEKFQAISKDSGDKLWLLPLFDDYFEYLKSDIADMLNCFEGRSGGSCTAAKFLEQFVDDTPWAHIDMAPAMTNKATKGAAIKGMSGAGVQNLTEFAVSY